jgi:nicotinamide-nucleotide amidase
MFDRKLLATAERILQAARQRKLKIATAESCTGGLVAALLTEIPGSSDVVDRAFVTYSNEAKQAMLGVPTGTLMRYGAVSRQTASAMARGALANSDADIAVAITGVAGPGGGTAKKPVGLVHFYALARDGRKIRREKRYGRIGRAKVRMRSVAEAAAMLKLLASGGRI